jgi:hypothetical protein
MSLHDPLATEVFFTDNWHAVPLFLLAIDRYGEERDETGGTACLHWLPETWQDLFQKDFQQTMPDGNFSRLMAAISHVVEPDRFYRKAKDFELLCRMFTSVPSARAQYEGFADLEDVVFGTLCAWLLMPPREGKAGWSEEVRGYIKAVVVDAGIRRTPESLVTLGCLPDEMFSLIDDNDDSMIGNAIRSGQEIAETNMKKHTHAQVRGLVEQLNALKLENGDTAPLIKMLDKAFPAA